MPSSAKEWWIFSCTSSERSTLYDLLIFDEALFDCFILSYVFRASYTEQGNCIGFQNQHLWTLPLLHFQLSVVYLTGRVNVALVEQGSTMKITIAPIGSYWYLLSFVDANDYVAEFSVFGRIDTSLQYWRRKKTDRRIMHGASVSFQVISTSVVLDSLCWLQAPHCAGCCDQWSALA